MVDEMNLPKDTTEYKFSEAEDSVSDYSTELGDYAVKPKLGLANFNWRKILMPVGILVAIFVVYGIMSLFSAKKPKVSVEDQLLANKVTVAQPAAMPTVTPTASSEQLNQLQNTLQQKIDQLTQQLVADREQIAALTDNLNQTQQNMAVVGQNMNQLYEAQQVSLAELKKLTAPKVKPKKKVIMAPIAYHVRAIVPGRVWLEAADGKSVTLRVGDDLPGYGKVELISPRQGMVVMSNGAIIQYGVNDL